MNALEAYERAAQGAQRGTLNNLALISGVSNAQGQMRQNRLADLQFQETERKLADDARVRNVLADPSHGGDFAKIKNALVSQGFVRQAADLEAKVLEAEGKRATIDKDKASAGKTNFDVSMERISRGSAILSTARDQPSYEVARRQMEATFGPETAARMPPQFDPGFVQAQIAAGQTIAQRLQDQRAREQQAETGRHNLAAEKTAAGTLSVAQGNLGVSRERLGFEREKFKDEKNPETIARRAEAQARGKEFGESAAQAQITLPTVTARGERAIKLIDDMIGTTGRDLIGGETPKAPHPGFRGAVGATLLPGARFVPGTDAASFQARLDELKGGQFLEAFESLKGGGAITQIEGEKATQAISRMSASQSEREFITAAREFQGIVRNGLQRAKAKATAGSGGAGPQSRGINPANLSDAELRRELGL